MPRDLSGKRVHVYSNFTFIERIVLDSYITKCIYLFIIFYLKLTFITACLLKQKESEQKGECGSDYSNLFLCLKIHLIYLFVVVLFLFYHFFLQHVYNHLQEKGRRRSYIKKEKKVFPDEVSTVITSICDLMWNQRAAT